MKNDTGKHLSGTSHPADQLHRLPHHVLCFARQSLLGFQMGYRPIDQLKNFRHLARYLVGRIRPGDEETQPWLNFELISFMKNRPRGLVVEFGSGRSTRWLAQQGFEVFSTEHQAAWADQVTEWLKHDKLNHLVNLHLVNASPFQPAHADEYLRPFRRHAGIRHVSFILVDGIFRKECLRACISLLDQGTPVILHDSDRPDYKPAIREMELCSDIHSWPHFGPGFGTPNFTAATIFTKKP